MTKKEMLEKVERRRRYYGLTREQVVFAVKLTGKTRRYAKRRHEAWAKVRRLMASPAYKKWLNKKYNPQPTPVKKV